MKYFMVEGSLKNPDGVTDSLLNEHMAYTQKAVDQGIILMSTLKADMSGGLFIMKSNSFENLEKYLADEPFKVAGIQDYKVTEFNIHYFNQAPLEWFND